MTYLKNLRDLVVLDIFFDFSYDDHIVTINKNTTVHLLSGGEKAMTAIALVFSIFKLNPAPFCMLDEVDAPLDDSNVLRYAKIVEEISSNVQVVYISHNKNAMEMANQLVGVTMHEAGVSRLVSVDIDQAVELAKV